MKISPAEALLLLIANRSPEEKEERAVLCEIFLEGGFKNVRTWLDHYQGELREYTIDFSD